MSTKREIPENEGVYFITFLILAQVLGKCGWHVRDLCLFQPGCYISTMSSKYKLL